MMVHPSLRMLLSGGMIPVLVPVRPSSEALLRARAPGAGGFSTGVVPVPFIAGVPRVQEIAEPPFLFHSHAFEPLFSFYLRAACWVFQCARSTRAFSGRALREQRRPTGHQLLLGYPRFSAGWPGLVPNRVHRGRHILIVRTLRAKRTVHAAIPLSFSCFRASFSFPSRAACLACHRARPTRAF
jgi:hypothetical protein